MPPSIDGYDVGVYADAPRAQSNLPAAFLIFAVVLAGLLWLHGNRLVFNGDEGLILDTANRMLHGETLYRDFFGLMSPGSYWLQLGAFHLFGVSHWAGRVPVIFDFALQCGFVFWLTARLAGRAAGLIAACLFFAFQAPPSDYLLSQHRMDSGALALASVAVCLEGHARGRVWLWAAAGVLIGAASICTPSMALLAFVTCGWLCIGRERRQFLFAWTGGLAAVLGATAIALVASGSFMLFIKQMIWLRRNYSGVNIMPYGAIIGGYHAVIGTASGVQLAVRLFAILWHALPALLPPVTLVAWGLQMLRNRQARSFALANDVPFLLAIVVALVASAFPRPDLAHLAFVAALPTALTGACIARYAPRVPAICLLAILAAWGSVSLAQVASDLRTEVAVATPVGTLYSAPANAAELNRLLREVHPNDTLYVHPYNPMLYFLSQTKNPTRYAYLFPGMMTRDDERSTLMDLKSSPPEWLLYLPVGREGFLRVFPHGVNLDYQFHSIEAFIAREYTPVEPAVVVADYRLYQRR